MVLNVAYAKRQGIEVGERVKLGARRYRVVGLVRSPLGGEASDMYLDLGELQAVSDRKGRVNTVQVRADDADAVAAVERRIGGVLAGASVTTAADLADRVGGSLTDARNLVGKLGTILTVVALGAAFLIASLLTLASVTKRIARARHAEGDRLAAGAASCACSRASRSPRARSAGCSASSLGVGGALRRGGGRADAEGHRRGAGAARRRPGPGGRVPAFGQGTVTAGTHERPARGARRPRPRRARRRPGAARRARGGGAAGGLRAARLRPADALRHLD